MIVIGAEGIKKKEKSSTFKHIQLNSLLKPQNVTFPTKVYRNIGKTNCVLID